MCRSKRPHTVAGFTLLEVLVVMTILFIMALVGYPALQQLIMRNKLIGITRSMAINVQMARSEAIKTGVPVVVRADFADDTLFTFANVDEDPGLEYNPDDTVTARTVDYRIATLPLPKAKDESASIFFWGPADGAPEQGDAVVDFTLAGDGSRVAVFDSNGSIRATGAFRIGDGRGNHFEIRVEPQSTARVEVRKYYDGTPPWGGAANQFLPQGRHPSGESMWRWYY